MDGSTDTLQSFLHSMPALAPGAGRAVLASWPRSPRLSSPKPMYGLTLSLRSRRGVTGQPRSCGSVRSLARVWVSGRTL